MTVSTLGGLAEEHRVLIRQHMDRFGLSISEVASGAGMSRSQLSVFLAGLDGNPTVGTIDRLYLTLRELSGRRPSFPQASRYWKHAPKRAAQDKR